MRRTLLSLMLMAPLAGCATTSPQETAAITALANREIVCQIGPDCDIRWSRALKWVLDNSSYRISTQSDTMISTFGPTQASTYSAFTISKFRRSDTEAVIDFRSGCDNVFGCTPDAVHLKASFVSAVMAP